MCLSERVRKRQNKENIYKCLIIMIYAIILYNIDFNIVINITHVLFRVNCQAR